MEVKKVSQGGQTSFDFSTNSIDNSSQGTAIDNGSISINSQNSDYNLSKDDNSNISEKDIKEAVDKFNEVLKEKSSHVEYEIYGKSKDLTIRIVDDNTKEVIKEIPPKKLIDMIDKLSELAGILVDEKA